MPYGRARFRCHTGVMGGTIATLAAAALAAPAHSAPVAHITAARAAQIDRRFEARYFHESPRLLRVVCRVTRHGDACTYYDRGLCSSRAQLHGAGMTFGVGGLVWVGHDRVYRDASGIRIEAGQWLAPGGAC